MPVISTDTKAIQLQADPGHILSQKPAGVLRWFNIIYLLAGKRLVIRLLGIEVEQNATGLFSL